MTRSRSPACSACANRGPTAAVRSRNGPSVRGVLSASQAPTSIRVPSGSCDLIAETRLVLPIPASPWSKMTEPVPFAATLAASRRGGELLIALQQASSHPLMVFAVAAHLPRGKWSHPPPDATLLLSDSTTFGKTRPTRGKPTTVGRVPKNEAPVIEASTATLGSSSSPVGATASGGRLGSARRGRDCPGGGPPAHDAANSERRPQYRGFA